MSNRFRAVRRIVSSLLPSAAVLIVALWTAALAPSPAHAYVCGDANGSGGISVSDVTFMVDFLFKGGSSPVPLEAGDANCDGSRNISDLTRLISYLFSGGAAPCCPALTTLHVSTLGDDVNGDGSSVDPFQTLTHALTVADTTPTVTEIRMATGTYVTPDDIIVTIPIAVTGGFDQMAGWVPSMSLKSVIQLDPGTDPRFIVNAGGAAVDITRLSIVAAAEAKPSNQAPNWPLNNSSYAVQVVNSSAVSFDQCELTAGGIVNDGTAGTPGSSGPGGSNGSNGVAGCADGSCGGSGGPPGSGANLGGVGGTGGYGNANGTGGVSGSGPLFGSGGSGGGDATCANAGNGSPGGIGGPGFNASPAAATVPRMVSPDTGPKPYYHLWAQSGSGAAGGNGSGGGGGGGGGGVGGVFCTDDRGGGGGGGGGGGTAGTGGFAGGAGGNSVAVFLIASTVTFTNCSVTTGAAADGGQGGAGGAGGPGGSGGTGSPGGDTAGNGGPGGAGGSGGHGSGGNGGHGGSSIGILAATGSTYVDGGGNAFVIGPAGTGGFGGPSAGAAGLSGQAGVSAPIFTMP